MEFQAVIMAAGTGSRMREITSGIPKCLLPVGNIPLIMGPLNIVKKAGFTSAIVIVRESEKAKIQSAIEDKSGLKLDFVAVPKNDDWGTADSLRYIKDKIKAHVIVLSCDVISDFYLLDMINAHWFKGSSLAVLLVPFPESLKDADVPGSKKKYQFEKDLIGIDPNNKIAFINAMADFTGSVPIDIKVAERNPEMKYNSHLMDAHVYIIKKNFLEFIFNNKRISTLKGEFLPAAVKASVYKKPKKNVDYQTTTSSLLKQDRIDLNQLAFDLSTTHLDRYARPATDDDLFCFAYIDNESFCTRVNSLAAYADINKKITKYFSSMGLEPAKTHQYPKSQVDAESVVGENSELLPKASIKQTVLGSNCKLSEKVKITNSVVMDNVTFGKECSIQNCIICSNVILEDNCSFKNSVIGPDQTIKTLTKLNSEILHGSHHLMEI